MQKIGIDTVCRHIYRRNGEAIDLAVSRECPIVGYSFKDFEADALADDFIASQTTVVAKWKSLKSSGVVIEKANRTFLDIRELRSRCERRSCA